MSEPFIDRALARLSALVHASARRERFGAAVSVSHEEIKALAELAERAIDAVCDEGCLPGHLCGAVVRYGGEQSR